MYLTKQEGKDYVQYRKKRTEKKFRNLLRHDSFMINIFEGRINGYEGCERGQGKNELTVTGTQIRKVGLPNTEKWKIRFATTWPRALVEEEKEVVNITLYCNDIFTTIVCFRTEFYTFIDGNTRASFTYFRNALVVLSIRTYIRTLLRPNYNKKKKNSN